MNYWLIKQEPEEYPFSQLLLDQTTAWTGVRNYQARNYLRQMAASDRCFYYHSGGERQIVGLAEVVTPAYPDPTATQGDWCCVEVRGLQAAATPLTLREIKIDTALIHLPLIKQSRLSVMPVVTSLAKHLLKRLAL
jgi:predicted RNA-binding protein with PUA-like domain